MTAMLGQAWLTARVITGGLLVAGTLAVGAGINRFWFRVFLHAPFGARRGYYQWERSFIVSGFLAVGLGLAGLSSALRGVGDSLFSDLGLTAYLVGVVFLALAEVAWLVGIVQWRRSTVRVNPTGAERLVLGGVLGAVALAVLLSVALTLTGRTVVAAELKTGTTSVQIKNFSFGPNTVKAHAGDTVRVVVSNKDTTLHTFTLPEAGVDVSVPPGSEKLIEFQAPASGTYQWYCLPHSSLSGGTRTGMVGTLRVP